MSTPRGSQKKTPTSSAAQGQKSILGFFKRASDGPGTPIPARPALDKASIAAKLSKTNPTPVPSSDPVEPPSSAGPSSHIKPVDRNKENGLLTPIASATSGADPEVDFNDSDDSPVRKVSRLFTIFQHLELNHPRIGAKEGELRRV
jgi:hypothetical protein